MFAYDTPLYVYVNIPLKKQLFLVSMVIYKMNSVYTIFLINLKL